MKISEQTCPIDLSTSKKNEKQTTKSGEKLETSDKDENQKDNEVVKAIYRHESTLNLGVSQKRADSVRREAENNHVDMDMNT